MSVVDIPKTIKVDENPVLKDATFAVLEKYVQDRMKDDLLFFRERSIDMTDLENYLLGKFYSKDIFDGIKKNKNNFYSNMLEKIVFSNTILLYNNFDKVFEKFKNEYGKINSNTENKQDILKEKLRKIKFSELKSLLYSHSNRQDFLRNKIIYKSHTEINSDAITPITSDSLLNEIFLGVDLSGLSPEETDSLKAILLNKHVGLSDLENLLSKLNTKGKIAFIRYFIEDISIKDGVNIGLIKKSEIKHIIEKFVKEEYHQRTGINPLTITSGDEDDKRIKKLVTYVLNNLENFSIPVRDISDTNLEDVINNHDNYEKLLAKCVKEYRSIDSDEEDITDLESLYEKIKNAPDIPSSVKSEINTKKLTDNSYLKITRNVSGVNITSYFYLKSINESTTYLNFLNITNGDSILQDFKVKGKDSKTTFANFYKLLKVGNLNNLSLYNETEFNALGLDEIPENEDVTTRNDLLKILKNHDPEGEKYIRGRKMIMKRPIGGHESNLIDDEVLLIDDITNAGVKFRGESKLYGLKKFAEYITTNKPKRFPLIENDLDFLNQLNSNTDTQGIFTNIEIKNNKFVYNKDFGKHKKGEVIEYFKSGDNILKIKSLNNLAGASFGVGKLKNGNDKKKINFKEEKYGEDVNYNLFYLYLAKNKYEPYDKKIEEVNQEEESAKKFNRSFSLLSAYLSGMSISDMTKGVSMMIDSIKNNMEKGNRLKAAKFAMALGKIMPGSVQDNLRSMIESEEKKSMNEVLESLKVLDSSIMIKRIEQILKNRSSAQYEIEGALFAIISKYGTLYAKGLNSRRGSYAWYTALGGKKGDTLYMKVKQECDDQRNLSSTNTVAMLFTEELLVQRLLKEQCDPNSRYYPKRRSKLHKDFFKEIKTGIDDEIKDGEANAGDFVSLEQRIDYCMGELKNGTYANGIGALEKIYGKGGTPFEMHSMPFVITVTGIARNFQDKLLVHMISKDSWSKPYTELMFNKDSGSIDLFKNGIKSMINTLDFPGKTRDQVLSEFLSIGTDVNKALEFWRQYGNIILNRMTGSDGFMFLAKNDPSLNTTHSPEDIENINKYGNLLSGMQNDPEYELEGLKTGLYDADQTPITFSSGRKFFEQHLELRHNNFSEEGKIIINEVIVKELDKLRKNNIYTDDQKRILFKEIYILAHANIYNSLAFNPNILESTEVKILESAGINFKGFWDNEIKTLPQSTKRTLYSYTDTNEFQVYLNEQFENWKNNVSISSHSGSSISGTTSEVTKSIDDILKAA